MRDYISRHSEKSGAEPGPRAQTFEFWVQDGTVYVEYNAQEFKLRDLLHKKHTDFIDLLKKIYEEIIFKYSDDTSIKSEVHHGAPWERVLISFLLAHFAKYDTKLDVIIRANNSIIMNLEDPYKKEGRVTQLVVDKINGIYGLFQRAGHDLFKFKQNGKWITFRSLAAPLIGALAWAKRNGYNLSDPEFNPINQVTLQNPEELAFSE